MPGRGDGVGREAESLACQEGRRLAGRSRRCWRTAWRKRSNSSWSRRGLFLERTVRPRGAARCTGHEHTRCTRRAPTWAALLRSAWARSRTSRRLPWLAASARLFNVWSDSRQEGFEHFFHEVAARDRSPPGRSATGAPITGSVSPWKRGWLAISATFGPQPGPEPRFPSGRRIRPVHRSLAGAAPPPPAW